MPRKRNGETLSLVAEALAIDPNLTDIAIAAAIGVSEQAVSDARRKAGIPGAYVRRRRVSRLGRCRRCMRTHKVPAHRLSGECPGCGEAIEVSTVSVS